MISEIHLLESGDLPTWKIRQGQRGNNDLQVLIDPLFPREVENHHVMPSSSLIVIYILAQLWALGDLPLAAIVEIVYPPVDKTSWPIR